ncbi:TetR family transcriptional regulator [Cypionkella aquatica]|uniref:TetR family transcriptional regulator n=1 Tax=Cypionkella aquatica TaxID=1756042 RepID=A0AA37U073_9RHOB|nr:TetR/AcrR family transcriptional regulator [Cypionkella aquatica]GLS85299.1 TetR family transcriptional regulator [Cypionkella aquatica]
MTAKPQLIVKGRKFDQVLEGARIVFMRDGFERASVDDIAREAGVSKATLYAYFPDKRLLFLEIASAECRRQAADAESDIDRDAPIDVVLRVAAQRITAFMLSDFGQRIFRIAVAESENFPAVAHEFYHSGPKLVKDRIAEALRCATERGELVIDDIPFAAAQFAQLCKVDIQDRVIFTPQPCCTKADTTRVIEGAVSMFMARYGAKT